MAISPKIRPHTPKVAPTHQIEISIARCLPSHLKCSCDSTFSLMQPFILLRIFSLLPHGLYASTSPTTTTKSMKATIAKLYPTIASVLGASMDAITMVADMIIHIIGSIRRTGVLMLTSLSCIVVSASIIHEKGALNFKPRGL